MNYVVVLAGGIGSRVGANRPKQFVEILGKPVLAYTLDIFEKNSLIDGIEIGCNAEWLDYCNELVEKYGYKKVKWICKGGATFQDTVLNCVNNLKDKINDEDYVMIQYGAAPFTKQCMVDDAIKVAKEKGMSVAGTPVHQLLGNKKDEISDKWVNRDEFIQIACPQTFRFSYLKQIYEESEKKGLLGTIEPHTTSLMYALGYPLYLSFSDQTNIKITTIEDLDIFEGWVLMNQAREERGLQWL